MTALFATRFGSMMLAVGMFLILGVMMIPMPTGLMDLALTFNIAFGLTVLLVTLYTKEPLEFSVFPSLLLVLTLMRLSLNVASTRLILSEGFAGRVIESFGQFVVSGNPVIGLIIFVILVIIQFVVITKGAGRVAEVAARFTLDAMPGKQMAIDADLNAGLIDEADARNRREMITREADFYGAMDGASKFVRGDAIAGVIITLINILAGFVIGVAQRGMSFGDALNTYTLLTVGDGLVTQIPALIVSVAAGMLVTRAAGENDLGGELIQQVFMKPNAVLVASGMLAVLGLVPGLPTLPFLALAIGAAVLGIATLRLKKRDAAAAAAAPAADAEETAAAGPAPVDDLLVVDALEIEIGYGLIPLVDSNQGGDLLDRITMIRRQIASELGFVVPPVHVRDSIQLEPGQYQIRVKGVPVGSADVDKDRLLAMNPGNAKGSMRGIEVREPAFGLPATWIARGDRDAADRQGFTVVEPSAVIATHLTEIIKARAPELLGRQEVKELIDSVKERTPAVVEELIPGTMTLGGVQKVLCGLLRERVSIRDIVTILETLADHAGSTRDVGTLVEVCRQALGRAICDAHRNADGSVAAVTLSPQLENLLGDSLNGAGGGLTLAPNVNRNLVEKLHDTVEKAVATGVQPVVLTSARIRGAVRRLIEPVLPHVAVLSFGEVGQGTAVTSVGTVKLDNE
ncbi:MAG: flagellar biosynthesis protein FlhA [Gemmatimonadetes bacterium]|nr:flagellar biosynthesis protein FlhA [Gemmatimonadota bacterium]